LDELKEEAIEEINCKIGMVREMPVIMVVGLVNFSARELYAHHGSYSQYEQ
jgi:hypothetical protein